MRIFLQIGLLFTFSWVSSFSQIAERLSLPDAIAIALKNNPQSRASAQQIDAERGRFWRGISPPAPSVSVNYGYVPRGANVGRFGERTVGISQSIDFPTNILFRGMRLSSQVSVAEAEHSSTSTAITSRVKIAYYDALARQKKIDLATENLSIANDFARKAETRHNVGEATNLERLTAKVQLTQARNALEVARNDLKISLGQLLYVLGYGRDARPDELVLTDSLTYIPVAETLEQLTERAYAINPQLHAASARVSAASIGRTLAWSSPLPSLNASYYRQTVGGNPDHYAVSFGLSVPLWFLFDQRGQIQEASANLGIAENNLQSAINFIRVDVTNAFLEMKNNERQIVLHQTDIIPQAEEVYRTASASYQAGEITYIEFLQARQIMISMRNEYIEELTRYWASVARLELAIGTSITQ